MLGGFWPPGPRSTPVDPAPLPTAGDPGAHLHQLQRHQLEALPLEAPHDLAHEPPLHAVGLHGQEGTLLHAGIGCGDRRGRGASGSAAPPPRPAQPGCTPSLPRVARPPPLTRREEVGEDGQHQANHDGDGGARAARARGGGGARTGAEPVLKAALSPGAAASVGLARRRLSSRTTPGPLRPRPGRPSPLGSPHQRP